jgi:hypothetical protein
MPLIDGGIAQKVYNPCRQSFSAMDDFAVFRHIKVYLWFVCEPAPLFGLVQ